MIISSTQAYVASDTGGSITCATPAAAAAGKHLYYFYAHDDSAGTITPPSGGWSELVAGGSGGNVAVRCWKLALSGAPASDYTVTNTQMTGNALAVIVCVDGEGGTFVSDTVVTRTTGTGTTATTGTATNPAADVVALLAAFDFDVNATVATPPADMDLRQFVDGSASELAVYSQVGFSTGTKALVWSTSEDWSCYGIVARWTAPPSGPTIVDQADAATAVVAGPNAAAAVFTVDCDDAITSCLWELEDSVGAGTYSAITSGVGGFVIVNTLATGTSVLTYTPTATTHTGKRVRPTPADAGGETVGTAVTLTVKAGAVFTGMSATTGSNGAPASAGTFTTDDSRANLSRTGFLLQATYNGVTYDIGYRTVKGNAP